MTEVPVKRYAIIVAGGVGTRMNTSVPKQFMNLDGKPVLMHTLSRFAEAGLDIELILVLHHDQVEGWKKLCEEHRFNVDHKIAEGGDTRFQSVKNGLALVTEKEGVVGVHDAARPLVSPKLIVACYKAAEMYGNTIPAIPLNDSIRQIDTTRSIALDRSKYCIIQTPQCFKTEIIKKAYEQDYKYTFTDDATVAESIGETIHLIDGSADNIKITHPRDFIIAEALLKNRPVQSPANKLKLSDDLNLKL